MIFCQNHVFEKIVMNKMNSEWMNYRTFFFRQSRLILLNRPRSKILTVLPETKWHFKFKINVLCWSASSLFLHFLHCNEREYCNECNTWLHITIYRLESNISLITVFSFDAPSALVIPYLIYLRCNSWHKHKLGYKFLYKKRHQGYCSGGFCNGYCWIWIICPVE